MILSCPKCGQANMDRVRFCARCHFPFRFVCPACAHEQASGGTCEACGVDFAKASAAQLFQMKAQAERETSLMKKRSAIAREILLAAVTGGASLLKYLQPRR